MAPPRGAQESCKSLIFIKQNIFLKSVAVVYLKNYTSTFIKKKHLAHVNNYFYIIKLLYHPIQRLVFAILEI